MKLSALQKLITEYHSTKSWYRSIIDVSEILALKAYITSIQNTGSKNPEPEVRFDDFVNFAQAQGYSLNLTAEYFNSNEPSAKIFNQWKETDTAIPGEKMVNSLIFKENKGESLRKQILQPIDLKGKKPSPGITETDTLSALFKCSLDAFLPNVSSHIKIQHSVDMTVRRIVDSSTIKVNSPEISFTDSQKFISFKFNKEHNLPQIDKEAETFLSSMILAAHLCFLRQPEYLNEFLPHADSSLKDLCLQYVLKCEITEGKILPDHLYLPVELQNIILNQLKDFIQRITSIGRIQVPLIPLSELLDIGAFNFTNPEFNWEFNPNGEDRALSWSALAAQSISDINAHRTLIGNSTVLDPSTPTLSLTFPPPPIEAPGLTFTG